jgi:hypothetical protein
MLSHEKIMRQLTEDLKEIMDALVYDWIKANYIKIHYYIKGFENNNDILLAYCEQLLNPYENISANYSRTFGKFVENSKKIDLSHVVQIIKYCDLVFKHNEITYEFNIQQMDNIIYLARIFGYAYCMHNPTNILEIVKVIYKLK